MISYCHNDVELNGLFAYPSDRMIFGLVRIITVVDEKKWRILIILFQIYLHSVKTFTLCCAIQIEYINDKSPDYDLNMI